ncbi:MAG: Mini-ribonuclease 3 [Spirulina sp. SIO3F2]|nr:Mini-ribonuclease 3 [Spirulina sp. SIO3F2]
MAQWANHQLLSVSTDLPSGCQPECLSPTALAYLGDSVYELYVRLAHLFPPRRIVDYHQQVVAQVRAERQAQYLDCLRAHLTPQEEDIVRRGRNATTRCPARLDPQIYQQASGFETLIGYLYLCDRARLHQLLSLVFSEADESRGMDKA